MISLELLLSGLAILCSATIAIVGIVTFVRSGGWKSSEAIKEQAEGMATLTESLSSLSRQVSGLPTAATISSHDARLKAVEDRVKDLPTGKQLGDLQASILVLKAEVGGKLDTMAAEMRGADTARHGLSKQVERIEQHLLDQAKGGI